MIRILLFFLFGFLSMICSGQELISKANKPVIDSSTYKNWISVANGLISNDGKYMSYSIRDLFGNVKLITLKECLGKWELKIPTVPNLEFSNDSKMALYILNDTLNIVKLGGSSLEKIPGVQSFKLLNHGDWVSLRCNSSKDLILRDLRTGSTRVCKSVINHSFSDDGTTIIMEIDENYLDLQSLRTMDIESGKITFIWKGKGLVSFVLNSKGTSLAFMLAGLERGHKSVWFYRIGALRANMLLDSLPSDFENILTLDNLDRVSDNGKYVFCTLKRLENKVNDKKSKPIANIWSYLSESLSSSYLNGATQLSGYSSVINVENSKVTILCHEKERITRSSHSDEVYFIQQSSGNGDDAESNWNLSSQKKYILRSLISEGEVQLKFDGNSLIDLSPNGKFVIYYDKSMEAYFSYELATRIYRSITPRLNVSWNNYYREDLIKWPRGIAAWYKDDRAVLIYDKFDVWRIDPLGKEAPINLTNSYGVHNNVIFDIEVQQPSSDDLSDRSSLILNALDLKSKKNGYFIKHISKSGDPEKLIMSGAVYHFVDNPYVTTRGCFPIKAKDKNRFIVLRMRADESPNYFYTEDFKHFVPQSDIYPEKNYNWYSTELLQWKKYDGALAQGVLYKPDNFDSTKKYPVLFYYHEKKSFSLNEFLVPNSISNRCNINIPTYVSNGYLVFSPDIEYCIGDPMRGTYNAVVSAAEYISTLPFVERNKMGIGGCSFGGVQTNYLVTHTNLFAAAYSSSSLSDLVSAYGDVPGREAGLSSLFETGQMRIGTTLWKNPDLYIKNSAIFSADKATTPLLMMHTTDDIICSFSQALELFTALRRLGKKVWLLEYPYGNHGVSGEFAKDFSIRLCQFFDHYLKGKPAPQWMLNSPSLLLEERQVGYGLDRYNGTPGRGLAIDSLPN